MRNWIRLGWICAGLARFATGAEPVPLLSVRWTIDPPGSRKAQVHVTGLSVAELASLDRMDHAATDWGRPWLTVIAEQGDILTDLTLPGMLGTYLVQSNEFRFEPRFPLEPGVRYRAVFRAGPGHAGENVLSAVFSFPERERTPHTVVSHVYPSADVLPENLLKFYLHFSGPMSGGNSYDYIHLLRENGTEVEYPFLRLDQELWDPPMTRLTLFVDPGRIKRGVQPNELMGPSITAGQRYTLVIDAVWKDGDGTPLKESFRKTFQVSPPDRSPLDASLWRIQPPRAGALGPLTVAFPKPLDNALAQRVIAIKTKSGTRVEGTVSLEDQERRWLFVPGKPWGTGSYRLEVQTLIEDLAGNNIGKPFEVDVFNGIDRTTSNPTVALPFEIRR